MTKLRNESMNIRVKKTVGGTTETNCQEWQLILVTVLIENEFPDPLWYFILAQILRMHFQSDLQNKPLNISGVVLKMGQYRLNL